MHTDALNQRLAKDEERLAGVLEELEAAKTACAKRGYERDARDLRQGSARWP